MKPLIPIAILTSVIIAACSGSANQPGTAQTNTNPQPQTDLQSEIQLAKQQTIDSVNRVQTANRINRLTADSVAAVEAQHTKITTTHSYHTTNNTAVSTTQPTEAKKKGMSNTTKGALIGTGAGIVTGAVAGALIDGKKGEGAIVGGLIGGAAGSGIGAAAGHNMDNKKKKTNQ